MSVSVPGPPFCSPGYSCVGLTCFHLLQRASNSGMGSIVTSFSTWGTAMSRASRCVSIQLPPDLRGGLRFMSGVFGRDNY